MKLPAPSYANVASTLALFLALGGTSFAVVTSLPAKSVGDKQLKAGAVTNAKVADGAITGAKIQDGTVAAADLAPGAAVSGPRGPRGIEGPQGERGPAGPTGSFTVEPWKALTLTNQWAAYGSGHSLPEYRREGARVWLRGVITRGSLPGGTSIMTTLPVGYRPIAHEVFWVFPSTRVDIFAGGEVQWSTGSSTDVSFAGVSFAID